MIDIGRGGELFAALSIASDHRLPAPASCSGPDGVMFYSWDRGRYHLEIEILPDDTAEFFYRDRETEEFWGVDIAVGDPIPTKVVEILGLFS